MKPLEWKAPRGGVVSRIDLEDVARAIGLAPVKRESVTGLRVRIRARLEALQARIHWSVFVGDDTVEEWRHAGRQVGVTSPGGMQQARHMADAAVKALDLEYETTAPVDITEAIARLRRPVEEVDLTTPAKLQSALDTVTSQYLEATDGRKRPSNTTVRELIVWNGKRLRWKAAR